MRTIPILAILALAGCTMEQMAQDSREHIANAVEWCRRKAPAGTELAFYSDNGICTYRPVRSPFDRRPGSPADHPE